MRFGFHLGMQTATASTAAPDPLAALYGTGLGQVPMHIDPAAAVMAGADVASIPNSGGAGSTLDATASATGITRTGNLLGVPDTSAHLLLTNPISLVGARLFIVAALAPSLTGLVTIAGRIGPDAAGERTNVRWDVSANRFTLQRRNASAGWDAVSPLAASPLGTALRLIEVEIAGGQLRIAINGAAQPGAASAYPDFFLTRIFAGQTTPYFTGQAGDVVSLIVDGNQSSQIATIRSALAAKHGITLA